MKTLLALAATLMLTAAALADEIEAAPLEEAQKAAHKVAANLPSLADAPIVIDADFDKPHLIKSGGAGVMIIPDKKLTAETLAAARETPVPVGQLWMLKATIAEHGHAFAADKTRRIVVEDGDKELPLQLFLLGAAKNAQGTLDLIVFSKDKTPLLRVLLAKDPDASPQLPAELSGRKNDEDSATLTLRFAGPYQARLLLMKPAAHFKG